MNYRPTDPPRGSFFSFIVLLAGGLLLPGCNREPEPWKGPTMDGDDAAVAVAEPDEDLGPPPAFNPEGSSTAGESQWQPGSAATTSRATTPQDIDVAALQSGSPRPGGDFNKFFPPQSGGDDMVAKQEKDGFAQYSLRQGGVEVGQLSITDLRSNSAAAGKFTTPDSMLDGYPLKADGSKGTTILVAGRYQVKVRSPEGQLNEAARKKVLQKFDLMGLADLDN